VTRRKRGPAQCAPQHTLSAYYHEGKIGQFYKATTTVEHLIIAEDILVADRSGQVQNGQALALNP
jgi:hypothetical protein